ncbi:mitochondrial thiamine pyrophosphate carrier-like [Nylanderia fulva]|uniref:mitochondrial thiamine pyrophosphate carrier-like n=1 Tax=Nylanderia fulva TaxID=613905 RepID=UPI0010FB03F6|nr:mitochondrial thiamine pyrophosphate carrier-like [Nylanderia fulva]XP_029159398.1 mitochondrial thiamine pyrophosphate carrier-like [Nylanderia fulva]XP_029159399.1 mitochondrial thiamine pyrophosphate carrier-like [Nylanderia fulva]XP_029159400.1 mitochondrial thiamine pyrophosphate carrier-like [Nylanderia fulva]XP_029159401.1 mitochondrial thiamine pyrophosphate carrier-like [Nylanderia fulva]
MGFSQKATEKNLDHAIAGAASGCITRFLCQPLDVIKIRFQLQVEPISKCHVGKYRSILQAFLLILKEEGVSALWKGHIPAQLLSITYGTVQFYSYNVLMQMMQRIQKIEEWNHSMHFIAGAGAGSMATIVSFPFDTIRTRLVAQSSNHQVYNGVLHSCSSILRQESPKVFFSGLLPTLLQIAPHTGLQFAFYEFFTDFYKRYTSSTDTNFYNSMVSGSAAGFIAKTIVYPFDLARKRLQIQGFQHGRKGFGKFFQCEGLMDCLRVTVKEEGVQSLFKGLVPSQIKATATSALHFTTYEQVLLLLRILH